MLLCPWQLEKAESTNKEIVERRGQLQHKFKSSGKLGLQVAQGKGGMRLLTNQARPNHENGERRGEPPRATAPCGPRHARRRPARPARKLPPLSRDFSTLDPSKRRSPRHQNDDAAMRPSAPPLWQPACAMFPARWVL